MRVFLCTQRARAATKACSLTCPWCRWNYTPSPGWTKEEANILKLLLMKFGVGKYRLIEETRLLPGKNDQQLSGQTQRLLGQQSLAGARLAAQSPAPLLAVAAPLACECAPLAALRLALAESLPLARKRIDYLSAALNLTALPAVGKQLRMVGRIR